MVLTVSGKIQPFLWVTKANIVHEKERQSDIRKNFLILQIFYTIPIEK